ncbi:MAG: helix-turn-helix transcriptional regulator [Clostridia bacterium]|nr:helix-turn-helix transcriptional regulator [Clostridia bacterium]
MYKRMRDLREDRDLVQKEVAAVLGTNQRVYSNYETGKRELPLKHAIKLAQFYGVSLDYLVGLTNDHKPYKPIDD